MHVRELAEWLGCPFEGDGERDLTGVAPLETADAGDLSFVSDRKSAQRAETSFAGCLLVPVDYANTTHRTVIRTAVPRTAFARAVSRLRPIPKARPGIDRTAVIEPGAELG